MASAARARGTRSTSSIKDASSSATPLFSRSVGSALDTYEPASAKSRGVKVHRGAHKPLPSPPARDCSSWQLDPGKPGRRGPYSWLDTPANAPTPLPKRPKAPPPLWLPEDREKKAGKGGASSSRSHRSSKAPLADRPPWYEKHNVMFSMLNSGVSKDVRQYFDRPKMRESESWDVLVAKPKSEYRMTDRQTGWNDASPALGESRRTYLDHVVERPIVPSYWRNIQNWHSFSVPDLASHKSISPRRAPKLSELQDGSAERSSLLQEMADTPAKEATAFWRGYVAAQEAEKQGALSLSHATKRSPKPSWSGRQSLMSPA